MVQSYLANKKQLVNKINHAKFKLSSFQDLDGQKLTHKTSTGQMDTDCAEGLLDGNKKDNRRPIDYTKKSDWRSSYHFSQIEGIAPSGARLVGTG